MHQPLHSTLAVPALAYICSSKHLTCMCTFLHMKMQQLRNNMSNSVTEMVILAKCYLGFAQVNWKKVFFFIFFCYFVLQQNCKEANGQREKPSCASAKKRRYEKESCGLWGSCKTGVGQCTFHCSCCNNSILNSRSPSQSSPRCAALSLSPQP